MKYALVTGAASGMGRAFVRQLAAAGYGVVAVDLNDEANRRAARETAACCGVPVRPLCLDLAAGDAACRLFDEVSAAGIAIEVLVCNAGVLLWGPLAECRPEQLQRIVALHCTTTTLLARLFGAPMRQRGHGAILVVSSSTAWMPYPTIAAYAATKSYLAAFAQALHDELAPYGVHVTALLPGAVDTPFYRLGERRRRRLRRWGVLSSPDEVARKGLRALRRGRRRCIPGLFTKLCVALCRLLPARIMGLVVRIPAVRRLL